MMPAAAPSTPAPLDEKAINLILSKLTPEEWSLFDTAVRMADPKELRGAWCELRAWFPKVQTLFTADDGKEIPAETLVIIKRLMLQRLLDSDSS